MEFSKLAERQILKAQAEGQFNDLKGAGKPIGITRDAGSTDAVGFRIMAEAGALPREIELRKEIDAQLRRLRDTAGDEARKREMAKLADLQLRLNIEQEARRKYFST